MKINIPMLLVAGVVAGGAALMLTGGPGSGPAARANITIPSLSPVAAQGQKVFANNCAACHGANAVGGKGGPPLIHKIYEPSHHGDQAFYLAVQRGVRAHHWSFGMAPVPGVGQHDVSRIIRFIREVQRANGIG